MNRRAAINHLVILSIGGAFLPSCANWEQGTVKLTNLSLSNAEEKMLIQLTDAIIPSRYFTGEGTVMPYSFILRMVDDCYEPQQQADFLKGLKDFDLLVKKGHGNNFGSYNSKEKILFLNSVEAKKDVTPELTYFYDVTKRHTIQAYTSSRDYMTKVLNYKMVPGSNFKGCVPLPSKTA